MKRWRFLVVLSEPVKIGRITRLFYFAKSLEKVIMKKYETPLEVRGRKNYKKFFLLWDNEV